MELTVNKIIEDLEKKYGHSGISIGIKKKEKDMLMVFEIIKNTVEIINKKQEVKNINKK